MALAPDLRPPPAAATTAAATPAASQRRVRPQAFPWGTRSAAGLGAGALVTATLVAALLVGGGVETATTAGLPDAGPVTGWGLPSAELLTRLLAVVTIGRLTFAALLVPADGLHEPAVRRVAPRTAGWVVMWLVAEATVLLLTASSLYAVPVTGLTGSAVSGLLTALPVGRAALAVGGLLLVLAVGCVVATRTWHARVLLPVSLVAVVVPVVLAGHSSGAADHVAAVTTLSVHVVTASVWVGGLAALLTLGRGHPWTPVAVQRFSALALACVVVLAVTGLLAAFLVSGQGPMTVLGAGWGRLLAAKTALLLGLAALGAVHRHRTMPALTAGRPGAFQRLGTVEVVVMAVTIAVSVGLASSPPPAPSTTTTIAAGRQVQAGVDAPPPAALTVTPDATGTSDLATDVAAEDMSGHDHGELSVTVLIDDERFHVAGQVRPGQPVTVYNSSTSQVTLTATDGSFDVVVPARTFITFTAPDTAGAHPFVSTHDQTFSDVLQVSGAA